MKPVNGSAPEASTEPSYTTGQAAKAAGISRPMLRWLWGRGLAVPSVRNSRASGSSSLWSEADVAALVMAVRARALLLKLAKYERVPQIRLQQLAPAKDGAFAVGLRGVSEISGKTTVAQLLRSFGGGPVALIPTPELAKRLGTLT